MIRFTEGGIAFMVVSNRDVRRVIVQKVGIDYYIVSFYEDFHMYGAIRVRHNRLYANKEAAEAAVNERQAQSKEPPETPHESKQYGTHWDYE